MANSCKGCCYLSMEEEDCKKANQIAKKLKAAKVEYNPICIKHGLIVGPEAKPITKCGGKDYVKIGKLKEFSGGSKNARKKDKKNKR